MNNIYFKYEKRLMWATVFIIVNWYVMSLQGCAQQPLPVEKVVCMDGHYLSSKTNECEKVRF